MDSLSQHVEPTAYDIARRLVGNEGNFNIGFISQCLPNERLRNLLEEKEKQIFKEIWSIMTPDERRDLDTAIKKDFPNEICDGSYWEQKLVHITAQLKDLNLSEDERNEILINKTECEIN